MNERNLALGPPTGFAGAVLAQGLFVMRGEGAGRPMVAQVNFAPIG